MGYLDENGLRYLWSKVTGRSLPIRAVSKADYEALPEEEKNADVVYIVPDGGGPGGDGGSGGNIPAGGIIIWSGAADAVPDGWALCDGTNGTPDLRDRFVLGAGGSRAVGATGGEETHKLTTAEMPSHTHTLSAYAPSAGSSGGIMTLVNVPAKTQLNNGYALADAGKAYRGSLTTNSNGSGSAHNNMPPYYALCYIMKL